MQVRNNVDSNNFGARWSRQLLNEVRNMRNKDVRLFKDVQKLHPNKTIHREADGWYVLKQKGQPNILLMPSAYDYLRQRFFSLDLISAKRLKNILEKTK